MTRVIAIANEKGGVGKTTTTLNLGSALAHEGRRTLLIDLDPQGSLSAILGGKPGPSDRGIEVALQGQWRDLGQAVRKVRDNLWLLPSNGGLKQLSEGGQLPANALRESLRRYKLLVDFVLIDTPPSVGRLTKNALSAAHELLIPVQCQFMAMRGVRGLLTTVQDIHREVNPKLSLLGVLANMYRSDSNLSQEVLQELRQAFGKRLFEIVIEDDDGVAEAPIAGRSVLEYQPDGRVAVAYRGLAKEIAHGQR